MDLQFIIDAVDLEVSKDQVDKRRIFTPYHYVHNPLVLLLQLNYLHSLKVTIILGSIIDHILIAEVCQVRIVVFFAFLEIKHFLFSKQAGNERIIFVLNASKCLLYSQSFMRSNFMAQVGYHIDNSDVRLPSGEVFKGIHVLVDLEESQGMALSSFSKQLSLVSPLVVQEPKVLLEMFVLDGLLGVQKEVIVLAMEVVLEGDAHHSHLLEFVVTLQMSNCAFAILNQIVFYSVSHI